MRLQEPLLVGGELFLRVVHGVADATPLRGHSVHYTRRDPAEEERDARRKRRRRQRELEVLLADEHIFDPPPEFTAQANASDPAIYDEAERDPEAWWESWAQQARLGRAVDQGARLEPARGPSGSWAAS